MRQVFALTLLAASLTGLISGCGTPTQSLSMDVTPGDALQLRGFVPEALRGKVALGNVGGGETTKWYWGSKVSSMAMQHAFEDSLRAVGMIPTMVQPARYQLNVKLIALDQPPVSIETTVMLAMEYTLVDRLNGQPIYQRTLRNAATVELSDKLMPTERLRQATEQAMQQNIVLAIRDLVELRPDGGGPPLQMAAQAAQIAALAASMSALAASAPKPMPMTAPAVSAPPAPAKLVPKTKPGGSSARVKSAAAPAAAVAPSPVSVPAAVDAPAPATPSAVR